MIFEDFRMKKIKILAIRFYKPVIIVAILIGAYFYFTHTKWVQKFNTSIIYLKSNESMGSGTTEIKVNPRFKIDYDIQIVAGSCCVEIKNADDEAVFYEVYDSSKQGCIYFADYPEGYYYVRIHLIDDFSEARAYYSISYNRTNWDKFLFDIFRISYGRFC